MTTLISQPLIGHLSQVYMKQILFCLILFQLTHQPVAKLFFKISIFLQTSLLFFEQTLFFLALSYLIVYVGAIAIQFIFILKLLPKEIGPSQSPLQSNRYLLFTFLLSGLILLISQTSREIFIPTSYLIFHEINWIISFQSLPDLKSLGFLIFVHYPLTLYLQSLLLFIVQIGLLAVSL